VFDMVMNAAESLSPENAYYKSPYLNRFQNCANVILPSPAVFSSAYTTALCLCSG
jgi:hypothetical protein